MKKFIVLFVALPLTLLSCSTEDSGTITSSEIIGTWTGTSLDYGGKSIVNYQGQTIQTDYIGEAYDMNYTLTFNEEPNTVISEGSYSIKLTGTVLGQTSVQNIEDLEFIEDGIWSQNGNILTISKDGISYDYTILELTDKTLKISVSTEENLSQQGANITATIDAVMTFVK